MNKKHVGIVLIALSLCTSVLVYFAAKEGENIKKDSAVSDVKDKVSKKLSSYNEEKDENFTDFADSKIAAMLLSEFTEAVNKKDYAKLYSMMDKKYIADFGVDIAEIKKRYTFSQEKLFYIEKFKAYKDRSVMDVVFQDKITSDKTPKINKREFTILKNLNGSLALMDIGIVSEETINRTYEATKEIKMTLMKRYATNKGIIYAVELYNDSPKNLDLKGDSYSFFIQDGKSQVPYSLPEGTAQQIRVYPQEKKKCFVEFKGVGGGNNIGLTLANGEKYIIYIDK